MQKQEINCQTLNKRLEELLKAQAIFDGSLASVEIDNVPLVMARKVGPVIEKLLPETMELSQRIMVRDLTLDIASKFMDDPLARDSKTELGKWMLPSVVAYKAMHLPPEEAEKEIRKMVKDSKDSSVFSDIFNVVSMRATEFPALFDFFLENIRNMDPEHIDVPTLSMIAWFKGDGDTLLASIDELRKFDGTSIVAFEAVLSSGITEKAEKLANEVADKQSIYLDEPIVESYTKKFPESAKKIADIFLNKSHYDEASLMYAWLGLSDQALQVSRMSGSKYTRDEILAISGDFTAISLYLEERFKVLPHLDNHESCLFVRRLVDRGYDDLARKVFDLCYEHKKVPGDSDLVEMAIALGDKDEIMNHVNESFRFEEFDDIHSILYALNNMETDFRYADLVGNIADKIKNSNNKSFK